MTQPVLLIAGPTASGKSALALRLAARMGGEVVNADSMQVYHGLSVLTARPTVEETLRYPHHLFGVADPADSWSAGRWLRAAQQTISDIARRGHVAIVVGGTGLYFRALTQGLADAPTSDPARRAEASDDYRAMGEQAFRTRLSEVDPAAEARILPGDRQRLIRAWEVFMATGRSLSQIQSEPHGRLERPWRGVALTPPRPELYARCDRRLETMLAQGALEEVEALMKRDLPPDAPILKAVGYREFADHLTGRTTLDDALAAARQATRRYAKRQMTWIRGQMPGWPLIDAADPEDQWRQFIALTGDLTA